MSATQDKSQKTTFVYSNLYHLYKKGKEAAKNANVPSESAAPAPTDQAAAESFVTIPSKPLGRPSERNVLKARDLKQEVSPYNPPELMTKRIVRNPLKTELKTSAPQAALRQPLGDPAIQSLKQNLQSLNELHSRLRFMLQELEELVKG